MKFFRYRKPSVKTALGVTKAKKRIKKATGITAATKPLRAGTNIKRTVKRKSGYYSTPSKIIRHRKVATPLGCLIPLALIGLLSLLAVRALAANIR